MFMIPPQPNRELADLGRTKPLEAVDLSIGHAIKIDGLRFAVLSVAYRPSDRIVTVTLQRGDDTAFPRTFGADKQVAVYI